MSDRYATIQVKREVKDSLKRVADALNECIEPTSPKYTVAGLVSMLADAYEMHLDLRELFGNNKRLVEGVPIILDVEGAKHFKELQLYEPSRCISIVSEFIKATTAEKRFKKVIDDK